MNNLYEIVNQVSTTLTQRDTLPLHMNYVEMTILGGLSIGVVASWIYALTLSKNNREEERSEENEHKED